LVSEFDQVAKLSFHCGPADLGCGSRRAKPAEQAANEFAAELLMPAGLFLPRRAGNRPSLHLVSEIAAEFQTTLTATLWRLVELTARRCALVYSAEGRIKYCIPSSAFGFRLKRARGCER
jgi:hypothetical protein